MLLPFYCYTKIFILTDIIPGRCPLRNRAVCGTKAIKEEKVYESRKKCAILYSNIGRYACWADLSGCMNLACVRMRLARLFLKKLF